MNSTHRSKNRSLALITTTGFVLISALLSGCSAIPSNSTNLPETTASPKTNDEATVNVSIPPTSPPALAEAKSLSVLDGQQISLSTGQFLEIILDFGTPADFIVELGDSSILADTEGGLVGNTDVDISIAAISPGISKVLIINKTTEEVISFEVIVS